jgi:uncharacterized protein
MHIKLFTHTDLDGVGCEILTRLAFKDVDIEHSEPDTINDQLSRFLSKGNHQSYSKIIITDISVNDEIAAKINKTLKGNCILLDHHKTAEKLQKYPWAKIIVRSEEGLECGTSLLRKHLKEEGVYRGEYDDFVELVRRYDTWEWKSLFNDKRSKQLNDLLSIYGIEEFVTRMLDYLKQSPIIDFDDSDLLLLKRKEEEYKHYYSNKQSSLFTTCIGSYKAGVVFADRFVSELGNDLAEANTKCDFIVLINLDRGIEYRTVRGDVNLGQIAEIFGGGGHQKAAGSPISLEEKKRILELIFSKANFEN